MISHPVRYLKYVLAFQTSAADAVFGIPARQFWRWPVALCFVGLVAIAPLLNGDAILAPRAPGGSALGISRPVRRHST